MRLDVLAGFLYIVSFRFVFMAWKVGQSRDLYKYIFVFFSVAYLSERYDFFSLKWQTVNGFVYSNKNESCRATGTPAWVIVQVFPKRHEDDTCQAQVELIKLRSDPFPVIFHFELVRLIPIELNQITTNCLETKQIKYYNWSLLGTLPSVPCHTSTLVLIPTQYYPIEN